MSLSRTLKQTLAEIMAIFYSFKAKIIKKLCILSREVHSVVQGTKTTTDGNKQLTNNTSYSGIKFVLHHIIQSYKIFLNYAN